MPVVKTSRLYRRTEAGRKVWDAQDASVPLEYRRVLGLVTMDTDPDMVRARLGLSRSALDEMLHELEEQGLVRSIDAGLDRTDLDFTGRLSVADIHAAQAKAREDLDFTGALKLDDLRAAQKKA